MPFLIFIMLLSLAPYTWASSTLESLQEKWDTKAVAVSVKNGKIFIPCQFDSLQTTCLLDSGSNFSTVNSALFDHYPATGTVKYNGGTGGEIIIDKIKIHQLKAAQLRLDNWPVARLPHLLGFYNIIGWDVFAQSTVLFNFKNLRISVNPPQSNTIATVPFLVNFGLILLPVQIDDQSLLAVWDTGASTTVIDQAYIFKHPAAFDFIKDIQGTDATRTNINMKLYKIKTLTIGGVTLKDVRVAAMDFSGMRKVYPDFPVFFLGYNVIIQHNWYFNFIKSQWKFEQ